MGIDRYINEPLPDLPVVAGAGSFIVTDPRGASTQAVVGLSATELYLLDLTSGSKVRLPNAPAGLSFTAGVSAVWDPSRGTGARGRVYVGGPGTAADWWWHHLDVDTLAWDVGGAPEVATLLAILGAFPANVWTIDAALAHPCTSVAAAADDNSIYLVGKNGVGSYRYDPTEPAGVGWTSVPPANRLVAAGAGSTLNWCWGWSMNRLVSLDAGGVGTAEYYRIAADGGGAADTWVAMVPVPAFTELPTTGTCSCTSCDGTKVYFAVNQTGRIYSFTPVDLRVRSVAEVYGNPGVGAATVGRRMAAFRYRGVEYLVILVQGTPYIQRIRLPG